MKTMLLAATLLLASAGMASAQPTELIFASPAPAPTPIHAAVFEPWAAKISAESEGTINIQVVPGATLGGHGQMVDRVLNGVVAMGWENQGSYPGRYPKSDVGALPYTYETGTQASIALQRLYDKGVIADEYGDLMVIGLFLFPNAHVITNTPVATLEDFAGLKLSGLNPTRQSMISALGGVPVTLGIADWYQGLSRGVIDGVIESYTAVPPFRLHEVTNNYTEVPWGGNAAMIFMNRDIFEGLPEAAQNAIRNNSGEALARQIGEHWDGLAVFGKKLTLEEGGGTVTEITPEERERWRQELQPLIAAWVEKTPDGANVLESFKAEIATVPAQ